MAIHFPISVAVWCGEEKKEVVVFYEDVVFEPWWSILDEDQGTEFCFTCPSCGEKQRLNV